MNILPLELSHRPNEGQLEINAEIGEALALGIEKGLNQLFEYYQYDRVLLRINSPGGQLVGLAHILQSIEHWRRQGKKIRTEATFLAGSAGALLLSLGEVAKDEGMSRTVQRHTTLLYHHCRINGASSAITAGSAEQIAVRLNRTDLGLIKNLVAHVTNGFCGAKTHSEEGMARCERMRQHADAVAESLSTEPTNSRTKWLTVVSGVFKECAERDNSTAYRRYLERRLTLDTPMDIREAYCLTLIDSVYMSPLFVPTARTHPTPTPRIRLVA